MLKVNRRGKRYGYYHLVLFINNLWQSFICTDPSLDSPSITLLKEPAMAFVAHVRNVLLNSENEDMKKSALTILAFFEHTIDFGI